MKTGFSIQQTPRLTYLSREQLAEIHLATLEVLAKTGVRFMHPQAIEILRSGGAIIEDDLVKFPEWMVKRALSTVPSRIVMANRDGERCMFLEGRRSYYGTGSCCPYTIDPYTGERRLAVKQDVANMAKLCDYLPNLDFVMSLNLVRDKYPEIGYIHEFDAMARHTKKPIIVSLQNGQNTRDIIEMAETIMGGPAELRAKPLLAVYSESTSPLRHAKDALEKTMVCAEKWVPVIHTIGELMGATAPATMAGAIIQANAEILSVLVLHQLVQPGAPFFHGGTITPIDMKTMVHPYSAPEWFICAAALVELGADYYNMPVFNTGGCSDAKLFDEQAAAESTYTLLLETLAGGNLIHDIGFIDCGLTSSLPLITFSNEIIGLVRHLAAGIPWDDDQLALAAIHRVGPGGHYLDDPHTMQHFRHFYAPELCTRLPYAKWVKEDGKTLGEKVEEKTRWILDNHEPEPLEPAITAQLDNLIERFTHEAESRH